MMWIPFVCLGAGFILGMQSLIKRQMKIIDWILNVALVILMMTIGTSIGINDSVMSKLGVIGLNCVFISLTVICFSVLLTWILEKTILPLDAIRQKLYEEKKDVTHEAQIQTQEKQKRSPLLWIMPISILLGVLLGYFILPAKLFGVPDQILIASLVILYISVGITMAANKKVFKYIRLLGIKIIFLSIAVVVGSLAGGFLSAVVLNLPYHTALLSAGGMSYYSITGAYMTQAYGIESGTYGFVVNVMREFFTIIAMPLLFRLSKGSPIAASAAGNMDTMLVPVSKFVGAELGLVALITGTILTLVVPFLLPFIGYLV